MVNLHGEPGAFNARPVVLHPPRFQGLEKLSPVFPTLGGF